MKVIEISWAKTRPAFIVEQGPEQSVIQWLDTGSQQALSNNQFQIVATKADFVPPKTDRKPKGPRAASSGPTRQDLVTAIVAANPTKSRQELIALVVDQVGMTKAGAGTYIYNAQKSLKK